MSRIRPISLFLFVVVFVAGPALASAAAWFEVPAPTDLRTLVLRALANQHQNDARLNEYERIERRQAYRPGGEFLAKDELFRVVPAGTGNVKVQLEENNEVVSPLLYRKQLEGVEQALLIATNPKDPRYKTKADKWNTRQRERREIVDAIGYAFDFRFIGYETRNGRLLAKIALEPRPNFKTTSRNAALLQNVRGTVWLEEKSAQLVRAEAEIVRDVLFGGGILGKVNRGGRIVIEQTEVEPGIWLPTLYDYDLKGRRFIFPFELREITEARTYRRIGPPAEALRLIRTELHDQLIPALSAKPREDDSSN